MASYFDEHDMSNGEGSAQPRPDQSLLLRILEMARLLQEEMDVEIVSDLGFMSVSGKAPPASKKVVEELETKLISPASACLGKQCAICLVSFVEEDETKVLPCNHQFHSVCIVTWLKQVNSCPICRYELPTDDPNYEEMRKHKARAKQREYEQETLHNSMFG
ncbi:hypothetical protein SNE40_021775 [Patella caerulea]|uniref:RING-type E3 ubiquitin transferase n=1 Tax=Patella caerulea TaxID=87958 RepID=A0AAN8IY83_PATCE